MSGDRPADRLQDVHPGALLAAHLDGELSSEETDVVEAHLAGCGACRADLRAMAGVRSALRALPPMPAPPGFVDRVISRRRRSARRGASLALAAACVALVAGLVVARPEDEGRGGPGSLSLSSDAPRLEGGDRPLTTSDRASTLPGGRRGGDDGGASISERIGEMVSDLVEFVAG